MKTTIRVFWGWIFLGVCLAASPELKQEVIPFPGGGPKISCQYFEQEGVKVLHGLYETFFASGAVCQQYRFDHGKLQGKCLERNADGKKKWSGQYTQDVKTGAWTYWDRNGVKKMDFLFGKDGQLQTLTRYNARGKKARQEWYENGRVVKEKKWEKKGSRIQDDPDVEEASAYIAGNRVHASR